MILRDAQFAALGNDFEGCSVCCFGQWSEGMLSLLLVLAHKSRAWLYSMDTHRCF